MIGWLLLMAIGFAGSALYSGLETGTYRLNRVRLQVLDHQGDRRARRLRRMIEHPTVLLTTLLIGNNMANQLGVVALTAMLEARQFSTGQVLLLTTLIATPLLFIFGETLPKDLFAAHADRLMYRCTGVLSVSKHLFMWTGLMPLVSLFTRLLLRRMGEQGMTGPLHPRRQVETLVREGVGCGLLSDDQSAIVDRVLGLSNRTVAGEMVSWRDVQTIPQQADAAAIWSLARHSSRSRFVVLDAAGGVCGILNIDDALIYEQATCPPVRELMSPAPRLAVDLPWRDALRQMQRDHIGLAIVENAQQQPVGIVTIKDLVELITGELWNW